MKIVKDNNQKNMLLKEQDEGLKSELNSLAEIVVDEYFKRTIAGKVPKLSQKHSLPK